MQSEQAAAKAERKQRQEPGANTSVQLLLANLKACSRTRNLEWGKRVHAEAVEYGLVSNIYIASALVNMYAKCGSMGDAHQLFGCLEHPNVVCWTVLILGYADNGKALTALNLLRRMKAGGLAPDALTLLAALKACTALAVKDVKCSNRAMQLHDLAVENACDSDIYVQSTLIDLYAKCGCMAQARQVFSSMKDPNFVSWTALIMGYADNGQGLTALDLLKAMKREGFQLDAVSFVSALKACTSLVVTGRWLDECRKRGREIHSLTVENGCDSNIYVQNTMIDMYAKCGVMVEARQVFDSMKLRNAISWNALIMGYAENGQGFISLDLFKRMKTGGCTPDSVTFVAALKACGLVGGLEFGRTIHSEITRGSDFDVVLVNCLVDFYAKCGSLAEARSVFDSQAQTRDVVTWTSLLAGFSSCGDHESVFELFEGMQNAGLVPNSVTFLCILACCSHAGLVEKGRECFELMSTKCRMLPNVEHYNCMVDIFGRANKLYEAMALLDRMPCSPNGVTWMTILGACRKWKNLELGRLAFQCLVDFEGRDMAAYALLGHIFRSRGMLREQEIVMRNLRAWKKLGETCWTNELGEVHTFCS